MRGIRSIVACACALLGLSAGLLAAQTPPVVTGVVRDAEGRPLPTVQVVVSGINRGALTDAEGRFVLTLPPGTHHIDAVLIGFGPGHAEVTVPESGPPVRVEITLGLTAVDLPGIEVTASPGAREPLAVPQATTQLGGKALERNMSGTLATTIQSQPGLAVRYAGPAAAAPVIRGFSGERVLVLENGQRSGDLSGQSADHAVSVDPLAATRIEVIRGPASLLYGSSALGGVVNVISHTIATSVPSRPTGYFAAQAETVTPGGATSASLTFPLGSRWAGTVRGGGRRTEDQRIGGGGELDNTFLRSYHGAASLAYVGVRSDGGVAYEGYGFRYGLPAPANDEEAGIHIEGARHQLEATAAWLDLAPAIPTLDLDGSVQWYTHDEVEPSGEVGTTFRLGTQTGQLVAKTELGRVSGAVGVSGLFKQYEASGEEALTPPAKSATGGAFFFQELRLAGRGERATSLQVGGRYDVYRIATEAAAAKFGPARTVDFGAFSGSVGISVPLGASASLGMSVARAFRAPTVEELFSNGFHAALSSYDVGNPALGAETNTGLDAVLRVQSARVTGQLAGYHNRVDDYITPAVVGDTLTDEGDVVPLTVHTQGDATVRGVEGQIEGAVTPEVVVGVMGDWLRGELTDGSNLPFMPAARLGASARWDGGRFSAGAEYRHAFAQTHAARNETAAESHDLIDLSVGANLITGGRVHALTLRVENLLDERYREATSRIKDFAPNPGRNVALLYRVSF